MGLSSRGRSVRTTAVVVGALLLATVMHSAAQGSGERPSLRLMRTSASVQVERWGDELPLDLGTYIAATGGAFELRVRRTATGFTVEQVVDGATIRRMPGSVTVDSRGLLEFFEIEARSLAGARVASTRASFCPAGYWQERADDGGPDVPTYPTLSGCHFGPVTEALVWGIDRGWATIAPEPWDAQLTLADGTYDVTVRIAKRYRDLLAIPLAAAHTTVRVTVAQGEDRWEDDPRFPPEEEPGVSIARARHGDRGHDHTRIPQVPDGASGAPDLVAVPAHNLHTETVDGRDILAFGATVWNKGPGPLVVEGFRRSDEMLMDAYQYFYENGAKTGRALVGTLEYDARDGHTHWHFTDFARYQLLTERGSMVVRSGKEAFCLAPTDAVDLTLPTANWRPGWTGLSTSCGGERSLWIREILDVGWGDTYHQWLPGQSFDITTVPNGTYVIEVTTNPDARLSEVTAANNRALRTVVLGGEPGGRTVRMK